MHQPLPSTRDIVLIGGGHAHAVALRMWGMDPLPGARLTLINPQPTAPYTGMLPGFIAGHYRLEELEIDMFRLARFAGARFVLDLVTGLDPDSKLVHFRNRPPIAYDVASINIGISTGLAADTGANGIPAKPMARFADAWEAFIARVKDGAPPRAAVVGGGIAGTELAMAMAYRLNQVAGGGALVSLLERTGTLMPESPAAREPVLAALTSLGVAPRCDAEVIRVEATGVVLADGERIEAGFTGVAAGARPAGWLAGTGLPLQDGFIKVNEFLQVSDRKELFAVGDSAFMDLNPREKAGVFAVRQGPILAHNLRALVSGGALRAYRPQRDYLKLISLGGKSAVALKYGRTVRGAAVWRLKDHIDRRFMKRLTALQPMRAPDLPPTVADGVRQITDGAPLCGGCGSKIGRAELAAVLSNLPEPQRSDVQSLPGDDAAVLAHEGKTRQVMTTDHLRAFVEDPYVMAQIAATHALGDIWAMGSAPQAALASIVLPPLSAPLQARMLAEIMAGASEVFRTAGADIVGGHSSQGAELSLGFTVTGLSDGPVITLAGARPGDLLVLSKPLGTGVVLAADMRLQASGRDMAAVLAQMAMPLDAASAILRDVATAMTDVTGFGLAGHLDAMMAASQTSAIIDLGAVPFVPGAVALSQAGVRSSLFAQNAAVALAAGTKATDPRVDLLFDPQTAGGLLAAVPADRAGEIVEHLRKDAPEAAIIGRVEASAPDRLTLK